VRNMVINDFRPLFPATCLNSNTQESVVSSDAILEGIDHVACVEQNENAVVTRHGIRKTTESRFFIIYEEATLSGARESYTVTGRRSCQECCHIWPTFMCLKHENHVLLICRRIHC
jgi:hypothetical protein